MHEIIFIIRNYYKLLLFFFILVSGSWDFEAKKLYVISIFLWGGLSQLGVVLVSSFGCACSLYDGQFVFLKTFLLFQKSMMYYILHVFERRLSMV